jgi:hypothetical protein
MALHHGDFVKTGKDKGFAHARQDEIEDLFINFRSRTTHATKPFYFARNHLRSP